MKRLPEIDQMFTVPFGQCAVEPLRVTFRLVPNSRITNYDPIHLDGLLARAVVEIATQGRLVPDCEEGYWIPLPLQMLWQDRNGFPLWAASVLRPVGPSVGDMYIRHKRNSEGWLHNKPRLVTRNGPWMERRMPTPVQVCDTYEARCIGNRAMVENLLGHFTHLGKLRLGRARRIEVERAEFDERATWIEAQALIRPVPAAAGLLSMWPGQPGLVGWTPPHWKPSLFALGWRAGTDVRDLIEPDFYADAPDSANCPTRR